MKIGIYHDQDVDGFTCGAIMKMAYPDIELIGWDYKYNANDLIDKIKSLGEGSVIMADVTLKKDKMQELASVCDLHLVDHHVTAYNDLKNCKFKYTYNSQLAACEILWGELFPNKLMPEFIRLAGKYDTWRKDKEWFTKTLPVHYFAKSEMSIEHMIKLIKGGINTVLKTGRLIFNSHLENMKFSLNKVGIKKLDGYDVAVIKSAMSISVFADLVWEKFPSVKALIQWSVNPDGSVGYSMRSPANGLHCGEFAKKHGGGGHRHAAGFRTEKILFFEKNIS